MSAHRGCGLEMLRLRLRLAAEIVNVFKARSEFEDTSTIRCSPRTAVAMGRSLVEPLR